MIINVIVIPKASRNELIQLSDTIFKAKVTAVPEKGKANELVIKLLSKHFKTAKSNIEIKAGANTKEKLIEIK